ncbi:MAG: hypothetical protein U0903_22255 [Planctomycetales bacterium]
MNDQTPAAADPGELQFNEAEYSAPTDAGATCTACNQAIPDQYFQINGAVLCEKCSTHIKTLLTGGGGFPRFLKASLFGLAASFGGFLIYFGVLKLTGLEIGLISILVGYMVGFAVRSGSGGRGGILYQLMAVCLTYLAIAASYSAVLIPELLTKLKNEDAVAAQTENAEKSDKARKAVEGQPRNAPLADTKNADAKNADAKTAEKDDPEHLEKLTPVGFVVGIALIFAFLLALPILAGISQPIGLLIVGFALWEAFKLNRKVNLVITGPHNVGRTPDQAPAHA